MMNTLSEPHIQVSQKKYEEIFYGLPVAFYTCDADGYIQTYNDAAVQLWGRTPTIGTDLWCGSWKIFNPDGTSLPLEDYPMAIALKRGEISHPELVIERPDRTRRYMIPYPQPVYGSNGKITGGANTLVDITEQVNARKQIEESETKFRTLSETIPHMIWTAIPDGKKNYFNKYFLDYTGLSFEELKGDGWQKIIFRDDLKKELEQWHHTLKTGDDFKIEKRVRNHDGTYLWHLSHGIAQKDSEGNIIGWIGTNTEIQDQKKNYEQLELKVQERTYQLYQSEMRHHIMIEQVEDYAIIFLNPQGNIEDWNKGAEKIKGYKAAEIIGQHFSVFYTDEDRANQLPEKIILEATQNKKANYEGWRVRKDGSLFWANVLITALTDENNLLIGFAKLTRDLTLEKQNKEELIFKTKQVEEVNHSLELKNIELELTNAELASFSYVASHDLKEPLRKIQAFSRRILETESFTDKTQDYFNRIIASGERMQNLIDSLLDFSRASNAELLFQSCDFNAIVEESKNDLHEIIIEKQATIEYKNLPTINGVYIQISQLFTNLIDNAVKYSRPEIKPFIKITSSIIEGKEIVHPSLNKQKEYHAIKITDNGIGFEEEYSNKIFELFQRLHNKNEYSGTGIGLAIVKKILTNHNGFIVAVGKPGIGSTFTIYIPTS